ncbi:MAG TPA: efflux transporter outer membrane subunit [Steroidobacteraceae bacterium]|jgi:NodT family efflux transporter outer membrane factor (OMF) lipoprotein|nr:efflux transporter outer membrane subunit [Steroidobacteraceae bacterium]
MANTNNTVMARAVALAVLGCTLAGCVVGPNFVKPKPNVPAQWSPTAVANGTEGGARATAERAQSVAWWSGFNDATLTSLVQQSAQQNLDIKQAVLRIEEAQAQTAVIAGGLWPDVSANASWARQRLSTNTPNGAIFGLNFPGLPPTLVNPYNQYQLGLGASWTLDLFGTERRSVEAANAQMAAAVEGAHAALLSMVSDVAATYMDLRGAQLRRSILERSLATQRDLLNLTRDRRNAGLTSDLDVENATAEVGTTQAELPLADRQITVDINQLSELMARPPEALRAELERAQPVPGAPPVVPIGLPSDLARRRPDIRQAEANLHAATAEIGIAISNYFPQLTLTAAGGFQSEGLSQLVDTASRFASFGPAIQLPIFEGGRLHAEVRLQKVKAKEAAVAYAQTVLTALHQVEDALAAYGADQARRAALQTAVTASRNARVLARQRYESGVASFIDVLDAERTEEENEISLADATTAVSADLVQLYRALGGGWEGGDSAVPVPAP